MTPEEHRLAMDFIVSTLAELTIKMDRWKEEHEAALLRIDERLERAAAQTEKNAFMIDRMREELGAEIRDLKEACADLADASRNALRRMDRLEGL
jgi:hypothetical protein